MMVTGISFWQIILIIMSLEVILCEVQCYINVYYYFLLLSNLQFPCQSVTHVWTFLYTTQSRSFLSQKKIKSSLHYNILWQKTLSWDNWLCWRITNVAAPPRSSNPHQCRLPYDKSALFRNIALQNGLIVTQRACSEFEKVIFWERNATQKQNPSRQWLQFSGTLCMIKMLMVKC